MKNVDYKFEDGKAEIFLDSDNDGKPSIKAFADLKELVQEVIARGDAQEGVKTATIRMDGLKLVIEIDSDKDGEKSFVFEADIPEGIDEGMQKLNV